MLLLLFDWLIDQPVEFFNVLVHTNLAFACLAWSLAVGVLCCANNRKKKEFVAPSNKTQPVSNSDATSKKTGKDKTSESAISPVTKDKLKTALPAQPASGPAKDAQIDEEKGERKKHRKEDGAKKNEEKGSIRISIHGAAASSSDGADDEIFMQDVFDDVTARDDLFPGEAEQRKKQRKKNSRATLSTTQFESDRVETTQISSDQQPTVDATNDITNEQNRTQTGYSVTQDQTKDEFTRDTTKGDASVSERPAVIPKPGKLPSRNKRSKNGPRKSRSSAKSTYDPSQTGETATESTKKRIPKNRKKTSECAAQKRRESRVVPDTPSTTHKDQSSARS